jgi:hypothetical protein
MKGSLWFNWPSRQSAWEDKVRGLGRRAGSAKARRRAGVAEACQTAGDWGRGNAPLLANAPVKYPSMIVARNTLALGDLLVFHGRLQHHAVRKVVDQLTLDLLPGRLMGWIFVAAMPLQVGTAPIVLFL